MTPPSRALANEDFDDDATYADVLALARAMRGPDTDGLRDEFLPPRVEGN